jgi:hypothetical protein
MDTFERLMKPGESDLPPIVAGQPKESELYNLLLEHSPEDRMPQKADPLPDAEIGLIERWIAEGATCDGSSPRQPLVEMVRDTLLGQRLNNMRSPCRRRPWLSARTEAEWL